MFGIDMGPSSQEKSQYNNLTASSGFATGLGESALTTSTSFLEDILSGDPTRISRALAPQINQVQKQNQQVRNQTAQFAPRSGGTGATIANLDVSGRSAITDLVGSLTGSAASTLSSTGSTLLGMGMAGTEAGFGEAAKMQDQRASKWDDLFKGIFSVAGGVAGGLPGAAGGPLDFASNFFASQS